MYEAARLLALVNLTKSLTARSRKTITPSYCRDKNAQQVCAIFTGWFRPWLQHKNARFNIDEALLRIHLGDAVVILLLLLFLIFTSWIRFLMIEIKSSVNSVVVYFSYSVWTIISHWYRKKIVIATSFLKVFFLLVNLFLPQPMTQ